MTATVSDTLNQAADLIEQRGWAYDGGWVGVNSLDTSNLCLEGGLLAALGWRFGAGRLVATDAPFRSCSAYQSVQAYLQIQQPLHEWNDAPERAASEVIEVLRACAVVEASREREAVSA